MKTIKKVLTISLIFAVVCLNAQQFGVKAGLNLASISGDHTEELDGRTSLHVGVVVEFEISDTFSFQPELIYSSQGAKFSYSDSDYSESYILKLQYLNIPLMAKFYVAEGFSLEAGPQIGFLLSAKVAWEESYDGEVDSGSDDIKEDMSSIDFSLNFGAGYKLDNGFNFGARYNLGLSNIWDYDYDDDDDSSFSIKNGVFQISVGYFFQ